jgi:acetate CoA/acetoacetate CoA-transferase beta subunit
MIVTEMGVFDVTENGLVLIERNPVFTVEDIKEVTEAPFSISDNLIDMKQ